MKRTGWLQDRRMQKFRDVLSRWDGDELLRLCLTIRAIRTNVLSSTPSKTNVVSPAPSTRDHERRHACARRKFPCS
jgi:hypothetical protein